MNHNSHQPVILTASRMARQLGVERIWLEQEARSGRIPSIPAGRTFLFDPVTVRQALVRRLNEFNKGDVK